MKIVCVIPARLESHRFPRKVLSQLHTKPLLQWVWEAALRCRQFDDVVFAIDAPETATLIESFGGKFFLTGAGCKSGTDRLIELKRRQRITADIWVNWQGDEPLIRPAMIDDLLQTTTNKKIDVWSLKRAIHSDEEVANPGIVKVVTGKDERALYFSRAPIPHIRDQAIARPCGNVATAEKRLLELRSVYFQHIGLYAFTADALDRLEALAPSPLEQLEQLEQLRFLENGMSMQVHTTGYETVAIDYPEDLARAEQWMDQNASVYRA